MQEFIICSITQLIILVHLICMYSILVFTHRICSHVAGTANPAFGSKFTFPVLMTDDLGSKDIGFYLLIRRFLMYEKVHLIINVGFNEINMRYCDKQAMTNFQLLDKYLKEDSLQFYVLDDNDPGWC